MKEKKKRKGGPKFIHHNPFQAMELGRLEGFECLRVPPCGHRHASCKGHTKRRRDPDTGQHLPCEKWARVGHTVCAYHGLTHRQIALGKAKVEGERQMVEAREKMERAAKSFGLAVVISPQQALLDEISRTAGHVQWLAGVVQNLSDEEIVFGVGSEEHKTGVGETGDAVDLTTVTKVAAPNVWVKLYQQERSHMVHVAKVAISCGIAERQVRIAEEQGQMIAGMLRAIFEDPSLELTEVQLVQARTVASLHLRKMQSAGPASGPKVMARLPGHDGHRNGSLHGDPEQ